MRLVAIPGPLGRFALLIYHHSGALWLAVELPSVETAIVRAGAVFGFPKWTQFSNPLRWKAAF